MDSTVDSMDYLGKCVYHLTHNLSKKILTVETPEDIYWEISHSFNIQHFTIQYYVKDFDDWVDFNSNITSGKLKIISTKPETHDEDMPSTSAKSDSESDTVEIIDSSDLDHSETLSLSDETSTPETNKKWPTIYKMPNLPNIIKQELTAVEQGSLPYVGDKIRRSIVTVLFEDMSQFTRYPMPNQYREVCQTLIREYPVLADRFSTTGCYFTTWLKKLRTRFKDSHRSLAENDYVMEMRKKYGHPTKRKADSTENKEIKRMKTSQTTDVEVFEDDDSIKIHIAAIKKEVNKSNLDEELIKDRLERTKQWRRNFIVRSTLNEVLQTFPILRISKWGRVPWNKVPASYESIADLHDSAWILLVPLVFKEKLHHFFLVDKEVTSPYPVIKVDKIKKIIEIHVDGSYISLLQSLSNGPDNALAAKAGGHKYMRGELACIRRQYLRLGIAKALIHKSWDMAREANCKYYFAECSSAYTVKVFSDAGFTCLKEVVYANYKDPVTGKKGFAKAPFPHTKAQLMCKDLLSSHL